MEATFYFTKKSKELGYRNRPVVVVCPGGGYSILNEREGDAVALRYQSYGIQGVVLNYSVGRGSYLNAVDELRNLILYLRTNSRELDINPNKIIICGFSAGAHLGLSVASDDEMTRPNGIICCYPVVSADKKICHDESINNAMACAYVTREQLSMELTVNKKWPPVFVWHNVDDKEVSVSNSIYLMQALTRNGVSYESHIWPSGGHGLSLADETTARVEGQINYSCAKWFEYSIDWIKDL